MVEAHWLIGRRIVEEIQNGEHRATYGEQVMKNVSKSLAAEFGRGFSERSVRQYRQFYQMFPIRRSMIAKLPKICSTPCIMRVVDPKLRTWYLLEAAGQFWDVCTPNASFRKCYRS
jgi:hypothetical protein